MKLHLEKIIPFAIIIMYMVLGPAISIIIFVLTFTVGGLIFGVWYNLNLAKKGRAGLDTPDE